MKHSRLSRRYQVAFVSAMLTLGGAVRASADSVTLSDLQVQLDLVTLSASVSAGLEAHSDTASSVFLDGLSINVLQDGVPVDLTLGPTTLDDTPFFVNTPPFMADGDTLGPLVLFRLLGLVPGAAYSATFFLTQGADPLEIPPLDVTFQVPPASNATVPEPGSLCLLGFGVASLFRTVRRREVTTRGG